MRTDFLIKFLLALFVAAVFICYFYYQSRTYLTGPQIVINYPQDDQAINKALLVVEAHVLNASNIFFNGRAVLADRSGRFKESLLLAPGYNIIEVLAQDKFGRTAKKKLELVLK